MYEDSRGFFKETFNAKRYSEEAGIKEIFVQDNVSFSTKNVIRGLHFQKTKPQGKLVQCVHGSVMDVAVDINPKSKTFCQFVDIFLTGKNHLQLYIPPGYAHGFCVTSDTCVVQYKCTGYYDPSDEGGLFWNDQDIRIPWMTSNPILSDKDLRNPKLKDLFK